MRKIKSYMLLESDDADKLSADVCNMLENGYELYGPPIMAQSESELTDPVQHYAQAIVDYIEEAK